MSDTAEILAGLRRAITSLKEHDWRPLWQPPGTAPKDRPILIATPSSFYVAEWSEARRAWQIEGYGKRPIYKHPGLVLKWAPLPP